MIQHISSDSESGSIYSGKVIVDFRADWCQPCKMMDSSFHRLASMHPHVQFFSVNSDACPSLLQRHGVRGIPTFIALSNGVEVGRKSGVCGYADLEAMVQSL